MVTVEQGHCTLAAVKRYWDTPCVGGRHNFCQRPLVTKNKKYYFYTILPRRSAALRIPRTHNTGPLVLAIKSPLNYCYALTWPGREFDQKGTTPSVEQGHCTLVAVKRYRDPPRIGGRHNFLLTLRSPLTNKENARELYKNPRCAGSGLNRLGRRRRNP